MVRNPKNLGTERMILGKIFKTQQIGGKRIKEEKIRENFINKLYTHHR